MDWVTGNLTAAAAAGTPPSITPNTTSQVTLSTVGFGGAAFTLSGTFTGTVSFYATGDGGNNWALLDVMPAGSMTATTTATAAGLWRVNVSGYTHVSMQMTAFTSGPAVATIHASPISAGSLASGGGGPGISNVALVWTQVGSMTVSARYTTTVGTTVFSTGFSTGAITPSQNTLLIYYQLTVGVATANAGNYVSVIRTAGSVPAAGTNITTLPTGDVAVIGFGEPIGSTTINPNIAGMGIDSNVTPNQPIHYYLGLVTYNAVGFVDVNSLLRVYQLTVATS
jgi:hypothetical protein